MPTNAKKQRKPPPTLALEEIEDRLVKNILRSALTLQILRNIKRPFPEVSDELFEMEIEVGQFIGQVAQASRKRQKEIKLRGTLANALAFISGESMFLAPRASQAKLGVRRFKKKRSKQKLQT